MSRILDAHLLSERLDLARDYPVIADGRVLLAAISSADLHDSHARLRPILDSGLAGFASTGNPRLNRRALNVL